MCSHARDMAAAKARHEARPLELFTSPAGPIQEEARPCLVEARPCQAGGPCLAASEAAAAVAAAALLLALLAALLVLVEA